jgi:outer membrane protein assembly factor BamB
MNIRSSPIIYDSKVYVGGASGIFYCFDLNLADLWHQDTGQYIPGSAAIEAGYVYIVSGNNRLYKLDANTGALAYSVTAPTGGGGMFGGSANWATTPIVNGDSIYLGQSGQYIICANSADGTEKWRNGPYYDTSEASHGSLTYYDDTLYSPSGPKTLGVTASDGTQLWEVWGSWQIFASTIVVPDTVTGETYVYIGSEAASMTCIDAATGTPISWYTTGGPTESTPAIYDGKLIFGSADHKVYCFEDPVFEEDTDPTMSVSLSRDTVYVDAEDSVVITAQLKPGIPCMDLVATIIAPNETVYDLPAVSSDIKGCATFTYVPDAAGNWSVMASWAGTDNLRGVAYPAAYSGLINVTALITPDPLVAGVSASSDTINPGESVTLTASASGGTPDYTYLWYKTVDGNGVPMSTETSETLSVTLSDPNVYGYFCEVSDSAGQVDASDTVSITVLGGGGISMELIFAIVGIIAVAVIAVVAYMYLKKRK